MWYLIKETPGTPSTPPLHSGTANNETQAPEQTTTRLNKPTLILRLSKKATVPETDAPIDIPSLALEDRPDAALEVPLQPLAIPVPSTGQRRIHPAYPDVPPGVPVDEEGVRKYCNPVLRIFLVLFVSETSDFEICN
jgi:hypothetical protein